MIEASQVIQGVPDDAPAGLKRFLKKLDGNGWTIIHAWARTLVEAEYYSDLKRSDQVKTPEHVELLMSVGGYTDDKSARFEVFLSAHEGKPLKISLVELRSEGEDVKFVRSQRGLVEWVESLSSGLTQATVPDSLF